MSNDAARPSHLFVVRLWLEPGRTPAESQWRGSVEHTPSGERRYFAALDELLCFVRRQLDDTRSTAKTTKRASSKGALTE